MFDFKKKNKEPEQPKEVISKEIVDNNKENKIINYSDYFTVYTGKNNFETRFLTLINYLSNYRDDIIKAINDNTSINPTIFFTNWSELNNFLDWSSIGVNIDNFVFLRDFSEAVYNLKDIYPIDIPIIYNDSNNSFNIELHYDEKCYSIFDFYTIPNGVVNSAFDALDLEYPSLLERYINSGTVEDLEYLSIEYNDIDKNYQRNITIPYNSSTIRFKDDNDDRFLCDIILLKTFKKCKSMYGKLILEIMSNYYINTHNFINPYKLL